MTFESLSSNTMSKEKYIIYGASGGGQKVADILKNFEIDIIGFCDSNEGLYGSIVKGKKVYSITEIQKWNPRIIIASDAHYDVIHDKLKRYGLAQNCILKEEIIFNQVKKMNIIVEKKQCIHNKHSIFIELLEGFKLGGVETWSVNVARWLKSEGYSAEIIAQKSKECTEQYHDVINENFHGNYIDFQKCIQEIITYVSQHLPCLLITSKQQQLFYAGYWLKKIFPGQVSILSVTHSDIEANYVRQAYLANYIDYIFSVSKTIKRNLIEHGISETKLLYEAYPPALDEKEYNNAHCYSLDNSKPIKISYAGRLETIQKRTDRFIPFIQELEDKQINYRLNIAGKGSNAAMIKEYINEHNLQGKICLWDYIAHKDITHYWMNTDVFINLSESEGAPLSLIEAMYCGAVPIVFDISGSRDFIRNNINGYILSDGDCAGMASIIKNLDENRNLLKKIGICAKEFIQQKCTTKAYINCILKACI